MQNRTILHFAVGLMIGGILGGTFVGLYATSPQANGPTDSGCETPPVLVSPSPTNLPISLPSPTPSQPPINLSSPTPSELPPVKPSPTGSGRLHSVLNLFANEALAAGPTIGVVDLNVQARPIPQSAKGAITAVLNPDGTVFQFKVDIDTIHMCRKPSELANGDQAQDKGVTVHVKLLNYKAVTFNPKNPHLVIGTVEVFAEVGGKGKKAHYDLQWVGPNKLGVFKGSTLVKTITINLQDLPVISVVSINP